MVLNEDIARTMPYDGVVHVVPANYQLWFNKPITLLSIKNLITEEYIPNQAQHINVWTDNEEPRGVQGSEAFKYLDEETGVATNWYANTYHIASWNDSLGGHNMAKYLIRYHDGSAVKEWTFDISLNNFKR